MPNRHIEGVDSGDVGHYDVQGESLYNVRDTILRLLPVD